MNHGLMLMIFGVLGVLSFAAFGMQRATLLLAREADTPQKVTAVLLPTWFWAVWLVSISKWALLIYIGMSWSWPIALGLFVGEFVFSSILPIPYSLYLSTFRRRVNEMRRQHPEFADGLSAMLDSSKISKNS